MELDFVGRQIALDVETLGLTFAHKWASSDRRTEGLLESIGCVRTVILFGLTWQGCRKCEKDDKTINGTC